MRYEDIASSAEQTVEHVYRWSGLGTVPSRVSLWINENTRLPDCGDSQAGAAMVTNTDLAAPGDGRETHRAVAEEPVKSSANSANDAGDASDAYHARDATGTATGSGSASARDAIDTAGGGGNMAVLGAEDLGRAAAAAAAAAPTVRSRRLSAGDGRASIRGAGGANDTSDARSVRDAIAPSREGGGDAATPKADEFGRATAEAAAPKSQSRKLSASAGSDRGGNGKKDVKCREKMAKQVEWDRYGTRRHAAAMVGLWRTQMPKEEAEAVWEGCAESGVMDVMGYSL